MLEGELDQACLLIVTLRVSQVIVGVFVARFRPSLALQHPDQAEKQTQDVTNYSFQQVVALICY